MPGLSAQVSVRFFDGTSVKIQVVPANKGLIALRVTLPTFWTSAGRLGMSQPVMAARMRTPALKFFQRAPNPPTCDLGGDPYPNHDNRKRHEDHKHVGPEPARDALRQVVRPWQPSVTRRSCNGSLYADMNQLTRQMRSLKDARSSAARRR